MRGRGPTKGQMWLMRTSSVIRRLYGVRSRTRINSGASLASLDQCSETRRRRMSSWREQCLKMLINTPFGRVPWLKGLGRRFMFLNLDDGSADGSLSLDRRPGVAGREPGGEALCLFSFDSESSSSSGGASELLLDLSKDLSMSTCMKGSGSAGSMTVRSSILLGLCDDSRLVWEKVTLGTVCFFFAFFGFWSAIASF